MASNDTLFNFDDTLGDREDLTPTPTASSGGFSAAAMSPVNAAQNRSLSEACPVLCAEKMVDSTFVVVEEDLRLKPDTLCMSLDLAAVRADNYSIALDVMSPEQQKTFSEDITSVEHVSGSDASGNMDPDGTYTTNTIEMETCISLNKDEEGDAEECDLVDDLEKDLDRGSGESADADATSVVASDATVVISTDEDNGVKADQLECEAVPVGDALEQTKMFLAQEIDYNRWQKVSSSSSSNHNNSSAHCVDAAVFHVQVPAVEVHLDKCLGSHNKSNGLCDTEPNMEADESNNNVTFDWNENCDLVVGTDQVENCLSGEEDPWVADEPRVGVKADEEMVTVFNSEWDKDSAEDSDNNAELTDEEEEEEDGQSVVDTSDDSSAEFLYVGARNLPATTTCNGVGPDSAVAAWDSHVDQIPIAKKGGCTIIGSRTERIVYDCLIRVSRRRIIQIRNGG